MEYFNEIPMNNRNRSANNSIESNQEIENDSKAQEDDDSPQSYLIDRLLEKRNRNGITSYKVKWQDGHYPTWEPKTNFINCESLFAIFEKNKNYGSAKGNIKGDCPLRIIWRVPEEDKPSNLAFLVEWMERTNGIIPQRSIVYQNELRKKAPQLLIKFYERCLIFKKINN